MCRTCGCGNGATMRLELYVEDSDGRCGPQRLHARLMGAPGVLHVKVDENAGQVLADFNPQQTSAQKLETLAAEAGYAVISSEIREMAHQHGITAFLKKALGKLT